MIPINEYSEKFENDFYDKVKKCIKESERKKLIESCNKYLPSDFFIASDIGSRFKELILLSYEKLELAHDHIIRHMGDYQTECHAKDSTGNFISGRNGEYELTQFYKTYKNAYGNLITKQKDYVKLNVKLIKESGLKTCPYCNRDYINYRHEGASGGQLDHFYCKSKFPLFALSLYNLVPSCGNCNRVKSKSSEKLISPHNQKFDFDGSLRFTYNLSATDNARVIINPRNGLEKNIDVMHISQAYQIHDTDVQELIDKSIVYSELRCKEIEDQLSKLGINQSSIKEAIFGAEPSVSEYGSKPLSKFKRDILRELKIY